MSYLLKRHPVPIQAYFDFSLVLTYAFPEAALQPLLLPGLTLNTYAGWGFVAVALVQTRHLRPSGLPRALGRDFFLTGYRLFTCFQSAAGRTLRGLQILRSDTNRHSMVLMGNLLTHYGYHQAEVCQTIDGLKRDIAMKTPHAEADLHVIADLASRPAALPAGSPFPSIQVARRFAGPLPFTFSYEGETHSIVRIEGVRQNWKPMPIQVEVRQATFLYQMPFAQMPEARFASAFYVEQIPYRWKRGVRESLRGLDCPAAEE